MKCSEFPARIRPLDWWRRCWAAITFFRACSLTRRATAGTSSVIGRGSSAMAVPLRSGEVLSPDGIRRELQLKGAGKTPYSRTADGRAVLRSSVREFLCSEAMHYLGVPTTRALSLVATGELVVRDMFYDGHPQAETGAIVCRVSPSFVRFGNFEILAAQNEPETLKRLADFIIAEHFPELTSQFTSLPVPSSATYAKWFEEICRQDGRKPCPLTGEDLVHVGAKWLRDGDYSYEQNQYLYPPICRHDWKVLLAADQPERHLAVPGGHFGVEAVARQHHTERGDAHRLHPDDWDGNSEARR